MHGNRDLITGWLKDKQGFNGFVISDYNGIDHIHPGASTFAQKVASASTPASTCSCSRTTSRRSTRR